MAARDLRARWGTVKKQRSTKLLKRLAAPQGFEPRYADPESAVLPLNEGAVAAANSILATALKAVKPGNFLKN
jgi:hypothetical protein